MSQVHFYFAYPVIFELTWHDSDTTVTIQTLSLMDRRAVYLAIMLGVFSISLRESPPCVTSSSRQHVVVRR